MLGWTAVLFSIQQWLSETPAQKAVASSPAYFSVGMAVLSLLVVSFIILLVAAFIRLLTAFQQGYMPFFMPPAPGARPGAGSGTEAPAATPP